MIVPGEEVVGVFYFGNFGFFVFDQGIRRQVTAADSQAQRREICDIKYLDLWEIRSDISRTFGSSYQNCLKPCKRF